MNLMNLDIDNGHMLRAFFKNIPNRWPVWADEQNKLWGHSMLRLDATHTHKRLAFDIKFKKISIKQAIIICEIFFPV